MSRFYNLASIDESFEDQPLNPNALDLPRNEVELAQLLDQEEVAFWVGDVGKGSDELRVIDYGTVSEIVALPEGFAVQIEPHAVLRLISNKTGNNASLQACRRSFEEGIVIAWAEDSDNEIIAARLLSFSVGEFSEARISSDDAVPSVAVTLQEANDIFQRISSESCVNGDTPTSCIPFLYPNDGCWARAHEMGRLVDDLGHKSGKIWTYKSLSVRTENTPKCRLGWRYHVASTLNVENVGRLVVDPSLFDHLASPSEWLQIQKGRRRDTAYSSSDVYYRKPNGGYTRDTNYKRTHKYLKQYRGKLLARVRRLGWPPYDC